MGWGDTKGPNQDRNKGQGHSLQGFQGCAGNVLLPSNSDLLSFSPGPDPSSPAFPTELLLVEFVTPAPSTETHWAEIWMDTFHCSLTQRATLPCRFPVSLLAPCSCQISLSVTGLVQEGEYWLHRGSPSGSPGPQIATSLQGQGKAPPWKGCGHCSKAQAGRSSSAHQRLVRAQPPFPCGKLKKKNHHLLSFSNKCCLL